MPTNSGRANFEECVGFDNLLVRCRAEHPYKKFIGYCYHFRKDLERCMFHEYNKNWNKHNEEAKRQQAIVRERVIAEEQKEKRKL